MNTKTTESDRICPACGEGRLHAETEMETVEYHGQTGRIELHFAVCDTCGSDLTDAADARHNKRAMNAFKKQVDGLLTGAGIRAFRERFGLTQKAAADLIGGGEVAFSRYESDDIVQSAPMDSALRLCMEHPPNLLTLAKVRQVELPHQVVISIRGLYNKVSVQSVRAHLDAKTSGGYFFRKEPSTGFIGTSKSAARPIRGVYRVSS